MKLKNKVEVAKIGKWNGFEFTPELLSELATNTAGQKIPITRGHTEAGSVSQGYITNPEIIEDGLFYDQYLNGSLADDCENENFINRSIELKQYNDKYMISSLALLGAEAPGIKGLKTFKEDKFIKYIFTEKIKKEVLMSDYKDGFTEGQNAKEKELTLKFSEDLKAQKETLKKEFADETLTESDKLKATIKTLEEKVKTLGDEKKAGLKESFAEKIKEVVKDLPEKEQIEKTEKLIKFSEKFDNIKDFSEMINLFEKKDTKAVIPVVTFSEDNKIIDEYSSKAY